MKLSEIVIGTGLQVHALEHVADEIIMVSKLTDILEQDHFMIMAPTCKGEPYPFKSHERFMIYFIQRNGYYSFEAEFCRHVTEKDLFKVKLKKTSGGIDDIQRRTYFRLNKIMSVEVKKISENDRETTFAEGLTIDISAGGMKMSTNLIIEKGDRIGCKIKLNDQEFNLTGEVRWVSQHPEGSKFNHQIGVGFDSLEKNLQEKLVRCIFEEQRKLLQKNK